MIDYDLPAARVAGALDNNGQPGSGTSPDAASVFTICATVIPTGNVSSTATQLGIVGDPNSLSIDVKNNLAYMLADTLRFFHSWANAHDPQPPLFLVRVDLSAPRARWESDRHHALESDQRGNPDALRAGDR